MDALKKSRSAYSGAITHIWNKFADDDPSTYDRGQLERQLDSIRNTDLSYRKVHTELCTAGADILNQEEEQGILDTFEDSVERIYSLLCWLIDLQQAQLASTNLQYDMDELESKIHAHPDRDYAASITVLTATLKEMKSALGKSTISRDHSLRCELNQFSSRLIDLSSEERKPPTATITTTAAPSRSIQLPKIALPHFEET